MSRHYFNDLESIEKNGYDYGADANSIATGEIESKSRWGRIFDSYRPQKITPLSSSLGRYEKAVHGTVGIPLHRNLTERHVQMIALGSVVGDSLFVTSGQVLADAGPLGIVLCYLTIGLIMAVTISAAGELTIEFPVNGAMSAHSSRLIDHSWGFAIGWVYAIQWLVFLPTEISAMTLIIRAWENYSGASNAVNPAIWISLSLLTIGFIHLHSLKLFGDVEVVFTTVKLLGIVAFIIFGIISMSGGIPNYPAQGFTQFQKYQLPNGFQGYAHGLLKTSYAFLGAEISALSAVETENPQIAAPRANKKVLWRLIGLLTVSVTIVACLVPYNTQGLEESRSPFTAAIRMAGARGFVHVYAAIVVLATWSGANAGVYASTRTLVSLAAQSHAPKQLLYIDQNGRPVAGILIALLFGLIGFVSFGDAYRKAFNWLTSWMGLTGLLMWLSIILCHVRFRIALKTQGKSPQDLLYRSPFELWGSVFMLAVLLTVFGLMMYSSFFKSAISPRDEVSVSLFFRDWTGLFILLAIFIAHKLWFRDPLIRSKDINLDTGSSSHGRPEMRAAAAKERESIARSSWYYKLYRFIC